MRREIWIVLPLLLCAVIGAAAWLAWLRMHPHGPWDAWQPPAIALPNPNGFDTYLKAFALKDEIDHAHGLPRPLPEHPTKADLAQLRKDQWLEGPPELPLAQRVALYADVLKLVRQALEQECRIPTPQSVDDESRSMGMGSKFGHMAFLLEMESGAYRDRGDSAAAASSALDCLQMARDVATGRSWLSRLSSAATQSHGIRALDQAIPQLDSKACRATVARLEAIEAKRVPMAEIIAGEERHARITFKGLAAKPASLDEAIMRDTLKDLNGGKPVDVYAIDFGASWQALGDDFEQLRRLADQPYAGTQKLTPPSSPLVRLLAGVMDASMWFSDAEARTEPRLRIAELAARAYLLDHKHLPGSLGDLVPDYMREVPADPFAAGPLRSKLADGTLLIYSIGPDGIDDGGQRFAGEYCKRDSTGDIVVEVPK